MVDLQTEPALNDLVKAAKECLERMAPLGGKKHRHTHTKLFFFLRFLRKCLKKVVTGLLKQPPLLNTHHPNNATHHCSPSLLLFCSTGWWRLRGFSSACCKTLGSLQVRLRSVGKCSCELHFQLDGIFFCRYSERRSLLGAHGPLLVTCLIATSKLIKKPKFLNVNIWLTLGSNRRVRGS